jgi:predicted RNase H-like nuclease (RuvC/YqgF family)
VAKIDDIRCFAEDIAQWRIDGLTWAQIAVKLGEEDICVGTDEIRSYWPRLSEGRSPAEYLLYWRGSQRDAELRVCKMRADAAEVEIEALRQQVQDWERQMQSMLTQDQQSETLRAECDRLREEAHHRDSANTAEIEHLRRQITDMTERAAAWQREATEANARAHEARLNVQSLHQKIADLQRQLVEEEARIAKIASETEVYGNIRYFEGKGEVLTQLDEAKKSLDGWVRFGESLFQAHRAGNKIEISRLLDRVASWAASQGKG